MKTQIFIVFIFFSLPVFSKVTWQQQAERLQKISMTMTESTPVTTPVSESQFDMFTDLAILPKLNSTVGSKKEDTKTPPVHSVPSFRWNKKINENFFSRIWVGALPSFIAGLVTEHRVNQYLIGVEGQMKTDYSFYFNLGYQLSSSQVEGEITAKGYNDKIKSTAGIIYGGVGQDLSLAFWGVNLGARRNDSEFYIEEDDTTFKFSDQQEDVSIPLFYQATVGKRYNAFTFAFTQLYVPRRILMPKISLIYSW